MLLFKRLETILILLASLSSPRQISAFWLTDSSLFVSPQVSQLPKPEAGVVDLSADISNELAQPFDLIGQSQTPKQPASDQPASCLCSSDWIQNQTSIQLGKWLKSADFANQIQRLLLVSNSTGALNQASRRDPKLQPGNLNGNHHWSLWARSFLSEGVVGGGNKMPASNNGAQPANGSANGISSQPSNNRIRKHGAGSQQQQHQVKVVPGPPGPRGDSGARGERGPSGLISVPDRAALFDLASAADGDKRQPSTMSTTEPPGKYENRLAFIEAEQVLVVHTTSGWQPLAMLAPLRDLRKATAVRGKTPSAHRRRLMSKKTTSAGQQYAANSIINQVKRLEPSTDVTNNHLGSIDLDDDGDDHDNLNDVDELSSSVVDGEDEDDEEEEEEDDEDEDEDDDFADLDEEEGNLLFSVRGAQTGEKKSALSGRSAVAAFSEETPASIEKHMKLRIAALNDPFSGNIHGLRGADYECKRDAAKANVKGSFRAFLASGLQNLNEVVRYNIHKYPIVNLRGDTLANSWHDLFRQPARLPNPLSKIYSFDGRHVASDPKWPNKLIWHGANNKLGQKDPSNNCDGWHSDSLSKFGFGTPLHYHKSGSILGPKRHRNVNNFVSGHRRKRALGEIGGGAGAGANNASSTRTGGQQEVAVLEITDRYPCRMPLIVLCIETIGQQTSSILPFRGPGRATFDQNNLSL